MKKLFILLCIFVLSLSMTPYAFAQYDGEITFRDIPWGTSFDTISSIISFKETNYKEAYPIEKIIKFGYQPLTFNNYGLNKIVSSNYRDDEGIQVGKYIVSSWDLYFAYVPKNNKLTYNDEDTMLYAARYTIQPDSKEKTYWGTSSVWSSLEKKKEVINSYIEKLTLLYGNPDTTEKFDYVRSSSTYPIKSIYWKGANNTEVVLSYDESNEGYARICITYAWLEGDKLLQDADKLADPNSIIYKRLFLDCNGL